MIRGMTGYGVSQFSSDQVKASVEIKSVNHRYLDINFYLPAGFSSTESKLRQIIQKHFERGRITVSVKLQQRPSQKISLNTDVAKQYVKETKKLGKLIGSKALPSASELIKLSGVLEVKDSEVRSDKIWPELEQCFKRAMKELLSMRQREGKSLSADVSGHLQRMKKLAQTIQARAKMLLRINKNKFSDEEFESFQRAADINEEVSRLAHYIDEMKRFLKTRSGAGKRIDFVAQEMQRETNTIGSKLQDKVVTTSVIALKGKIEKIREQAQNIE